MSTASATHSSGTYFTSIGTRLLAGVIGGFIGGVVFGGMMAMLGMLNTIASMVGSTSAWVGLIIHLMLSIVFGAIFVVLAGNRLLHGYGRGILAGLVYGIIWWVLGFQLIMPMMMGTPVFALGPAVLLPLMGHLIYGAILALVSVWIVRKRLA